MVKRPRLRTMLTTLTLYAFSAAAIAYFGINAYTGSRGLLARQDIELQSAELGAEVAKLRAERVRWEHRIALLRADRLDPDMLDERARALLGFVGAKDLMLLVKQP